MFPIVVGLNYKTAPVEVRERVSVHHSQMTSVLKKVQMYSGIEGVVLLSTCNRFEIYAVTTDVETGLNSLKNFMMELSKDEGECIEKYIYTYSLYPTVKHLFRVVSGLDSMVLGESQILGQVAKAYELSCAAEVTNKVINVTFQKALAVGKKVRTETCIDQFSTSISYTAVELAKQITGSFQDKKILILGTGDMSSLTMKHLVAQGASTFIVSNRSMDRARDFAAQCQGQAVPLSDLDLCLEEVDLVFSATASKDFIVKADQMTKVMKKRKHRPLLMIDIAVPRDIDPDIKNIHGISLYDIDDLREVVDSHQSARELAALEAEKIISKEMDLFKDWHNSLSVLPTIAALQQRGEEIKSTLLNQAMPKLEGISPKQEKVIRALANSIINNLLHTPITTLKKVSNTPHGHLYTKVIQNSFALDLDVERAEWEKAK